MPHCHKVLARIKITPDADSGEKMIRAVTSSTGCR
jgi:hypothetical protein